MGGYGYAAAGLVNGEMLPLALVDRMGGWPWARLAFIDRRPPAPPGGSVLYKSERALAVVVQSEVGSVE